MTTLTYKQVIDMAQELEEIEPKERALEEGIKENLEILKVAMKGFKTLLDQDKLQKVKDYDNKVNSIQEEAKKLIEGLKGKSKDGGKVSKKVDALIKKYQEKLNHHYESNRDMIDDFIKHREEIKETNVDIILKPITKVDFLKGLVDYETIKFLIK